MVQQQSTRRCEVCGASGLLVQFGDEGGYRYHCLTCWWNRGEQVVLAYVEAQQAPAGAAPVTGGAAADG